MGRNKKTEKEIIGQVLKIVGLGVLYTAISVLAPMFPYLVLKAYLKKKFKQSYSTKQIYNSVHYIKRKKFIAFQNNQFVLSELGKKYLEHKSFDEVVIKKIPWDGKWRVVTFDIPEEKSKARGILRYRLKHMGFCHFQRSVFIIPHPCEKEINPEIRCS